MDPCPRGQAVCRSLEAPARWPADRALPPWASCASSARAKRVRVTDRRHDLGPLVYRQPLWRGFGGRGSVERDIFAGLIARLAKRRSHNVRSGGEELIALPRLCGAPLPDEDLESGESDAGALAEVARLGQG